MRPGEAFEPPYLRPRFFGAGLANGNSGLIEALSAFASGSMSTNLIPIAAQKAGARHAAEWYRTSATCLNVQDNGEHLGISA